MVLLQSSVHVDVVDLESNEAIMTKCPISNTPENKKNKLLATYRCAEPMRRMEMAMQTVEGQFGTVQAFVFVNLEPRTAQMVKFEVKPLSLHTKVRTKLLLRSFSQILSHDFSWYLLRQQLAP